ncbi:MAG: sigma-70 family RNA polymerase sigma factor [Prevotella sp.]|jgi:RNA polymerase sigma-70 factor (ECF subfamily)|nr:sigma-70 family RNA polymerase sigma factor [Prevotella sp.]
MTKQEEQLLMQQLSDPTTQRKAFEQVVREYGEQLYWQIRRLVLVHEDADDVLQNVFIKAWSHLDDFHQDSRLSTWLYRIAVNESLDFLRKQKNNSMIHTDDVESGVANMLVADNYFDGDETQALLQEAISQLPEVQRTVFTLRYYDEMKYSEISQLLKTSEGSLKASYHIAVKKISEFFRHRD